MANLAIIVAADLPSLQAVADERNCTLIDETVREFDGLVTFKDQVMMPAGNISVGRNGWVGLARRN